MTGTSLVKANRPERIPEDRIEIVEHQGWVWERPFPGPRNVNCSYVHAGPSYGKSSYLNEAMRRATARVAEKITKDLDELIMRSVRGAP